MTVIKQQSVTESGHQKHLRDYINNDRKVLLRDEQNMSACHDLKQWASYMSRTREHYGHNKSARKIRDKETGELVDAKNTILYHQVLAFLPDECDVNGGRLKPEDCMRFAKEYASRYYPNQQIVFALHKEHCKEDHTYRYAIHMVINRTNLATGTRIDEGASANAKKKRAARVRTMDKEWGLQQVEEGVQNSKVHAKQASKIEKEIESRGVRSYKTNLRELCRIAAQRATNLVEYRELLEGWGVDTQFRRGRMYVTDTDNARYSFSVTKLDASLNPEGLERAFRNNTAGSSANGTDRVETLRAEYLSGIRDAYLAYRRQAQSMEGTTLSMFPKLKLHRPPEEIAGDPEVRRTILAYWRGADELRVKLASDVPYARRQEKHGETTSATTSAGRSIPRETHDRKQER